jgi:hypothetical protein
MKYGAIYGISSSVTGARTPYAHLDGRTAHDRVTVLELGQTSIAKKEAIVAQLRIELGEGFKDDTVVVRIDGAETYSAHGVTTKLLTSYADYLERDVPDGKVTIEVDVPTRGLSATVPEEVHGIHALRLSIEDGRLRHRAQPGTM